MAFPRHERNQQVAAKRHLTVVSTWAIGQNLAGLYALTHGNQRGLVVVGALVGALELAQDVGIALALIIHDGNDVSGDVFNYTGLWRDDDVAGVISSALLHTGTHQWGLGANQRDRLLLHVRAHQGTVSIVVLQERNHGGTNGDHLARGNVNVVHTGGIGHSDVTLLQADLDALTDQTAFLVLLHLGLSNSEAILLISGEVLNLIRNLAVNDLAIRGLDEAEGVHAGVGRQRTNQANVRTLRGLNRAHAAVVRSVHVSHLNAGALTGQTAWAQRGQAALVGQARQGVVVVHELRELGGTKELADSSRDRTHVNQGRRRDGLSVLGGHALAHDALHAGQAHADLVLDELTHGAQTTVTKVVDIVGVQRDHLAVWRLHLTLANVQAYQVLQGDGDVFFGQSHQTVVVAAKAQLAVGLVTANLGKVIALSAEEGVIQQGLRQLTGRLLARALLAVDLQQRFIGIGNAVRFQGGHHELREAEALPDLLLGPTQRLQQDGHRLAALAVNAHADGIALVHVELQPSTAGRNNLHGVQRAFGGLIDGTIEVHTRGTHQLGDDDALGTVHDEGTHIRHDREVADEDGLRLNLLGVVINKLCGHVQRRGVIDVLFFTLIDGVFHRLEARLRQGQGHIARVVLNRRELFEDILKAARHACVIAALSLLTLAPFRRADEPSKGIELYVKEARQGDRLANFCKRVSLRGSGDIGH